MKILWFGNIVLPDISRKENLPITHLGGWMVDFARKVGGESANTLIYIFDNSCEIKGELEYCKYYGCVSENEDKPSNHYIDCICEILLAEKPEIIHIWGTEYPHSLGVVEAARRIGVIGRVVISIQGLVSVYSKHYTAYLPDKVVKGYSLANLKKGNLKKSQHAFETRGINEIEAINQVKHVIGRTEWDRACVWHINPGVAYHFNNETLRNEFYSGQWGYENCKKYNIFMSQAYNPIKGLHLMLSELGNIVKIYPNTTLCIAGNSYTDKPGFKRTKYEKYCLELIKRNHLEGHVKFLGNLDAGGMKKQFLSSNVFACCSIIENSPNSVGEAMLLGVPVVASDVGGTHNMLVHGEEGYLYPADEAYMLSYYICKIFESRELAERLSRNAQKHAKITHNPDINLKGLMEIYHEIAGGIEAE